MASTPRVESIVMPHDGSLPYIVDFLLVTPGTSDISINDCKEYEELLGLIPKIWAPERHEQKFSWEHRSVAVISAKDIENHGGDWRETYLLYTCRDEEAELPLNKYLKRISDKLVYGDAYFFKLMMERQLDDGGVPPKYLDLELDFIFDLDQAMSLSVIVRSLLDWLAEEEEKDFRDLLIEEAEKLSLDSLGSHV